MAMSVTPAQNAALTFTGNTGDRVSLYTQKDSSLQLQWATVSITAPDGQTLIYGQSLITGATDFSDGITLPQTGTYTIYFNPYSNATGTATFTLYSVPQDAGGPITAGGSAVQAMITTPGQNATLTFSGNAGDRVSLLTQKDTSLQQYWEVVSITAPDGQTLIYNSLATGSTDFSDLLILPQSGTYTILFDPYSMSMATGTATFTLYSVPADVTKPITIGGGTVPVNITAPAQNASLTLTLTTAAQAGLVLDSSLMNDTTGMSDTAGQISILNPDGTALVGVTNYCCGGYSSGTLSFNQTGNYTIYINPNGLAIGTTNATLSAPPGHAPIRPGAAVNASAGIAFNSTQTYPISTPGQGLQLTFTAAQANSRVSLYTQRDSSLQQQPASISIIAPDGRTQIYNNANVSGPADFSDVLTLPAPGTYTILLNEPMGTGEATVTLYSVPADFSGAVAAGGSTVPVKIMTPGQNAALTFTVTSANPVSLLVDSSKMTDDTGQILVLNPDGTSLVNATGYCCGGYSSGPLTVSQPGTYTIKLNPNGLATGITNVTLSNVQLAPASVALGNPAFQSELTIKTASKTGAVYFDGRAGDRMSLFVDTSGMTGDPGSASLSIHNPDGSALVNGFGLCCKTKHFISATPLMQSGKYSAVLDPGGGLTGPVTFATYMVPPDPDSWITIGGQPAQLLTGVPGQGMWVRFATKSANQTADIQIAADPSFASSCYTVDLLDPSGHVLHEDQGCSVAYASGVLTLAQAGNYAVKITPTWMATGRASIGVAAQ
jgi:hypothetical protein